MTLISRIFTRFRTAPQAPERLPSSDDLVLLSRPAGEPAAAMIAQDLLRQQGIHAMVRNRDAASARAAGWGPAWAYELWVLRRDRRRAREIIGE